MKYICPWGRYHLRALKHLNDMQDNQRLVQDGLYDQSLNNSLVIVSEGRDMMDSRIWMYFLEHL